MEHTVFLSDFKKKLIIFSGFYTSYKIPNIKFYKSLQDKNYSILTIEIDYSDTWENILTNINKLINNTGFNDGIIITISGGGVVGCRYIEKYDNVRMLMTIDMSTSSTIGYIERNMQKIQHDNKKVFCQKNLLDNIKSPFNISNDVPVIHHMNYGSSKQKDLKLDYLNKITPNCHIILYPYNTHHLHVTEENKIIDTIDNIFSIDNTISLALLIL